MTIFTHETAIVDDGAIIGDGTKVWHWTHVSSRASIGRNCSLGQNVYIADNVKIGDNCKIQNNVSIYEGVIIGNNVFCGPSMVFTNVINPRSEVNRKSEYLQTIVEDGVTFGANCTIVCGTKIGLSSFVAAGSVVTKNTKPFSLNIGVPARHVGWISAFGRAINLPLDGEGEYICPDSCNKYYLRDGLLTMEAL